MLNATIVKRVEITPDLLIIGVLPDGGVPDFHPGQYVALGLPGSAPRPVEFPPLREQTESEKLIKRAYSIGSSPQFKECLEFYIAVVRDGSLTSRLVELKPGDRLFAAPKVVGTFTIGEIPPEHNLVLVSTGTGLAPYIAMLRTPASWTAGRKITVIHGVRYVPDLGYRDELLELAGKHTELRYLPVVSRADTNWQGLRGYAQHLFSDAGIGGVKVALDPTHDHVFLCGNPAMVEESEQLLLARGFIVHAKRTPGNLHVEKYW